MIKNGWWLLAAVFFVFSPARAGVVINEFAYYLDPAGDTGKEWIELYNPDSLAQDLSGYDIYCGRTPHYIMPNGFSLAGRSFVVLHLDLSGTNTNNDLYEGTAPTENMPNTKASVAIFTSSNRDSIVDFVQYGAVNQTYEATAANAGIWTRGAFLDTTTCAWSLGLASDGADSNRIADWSEFPRPTLGYTNTPQNYDVALSIPYAVPPEVPAGSPFTISAGVRNQGTRTARNVFIKFYLDTNGDSVCQPGETVWHQEQWDSLPGDRVCSFTSNAQPEGAYRIMASALCDSETYLANNHQAFSYLAGSPLVINEIMYAPSTAAKEWVEVYNRSGSAVDICNWTIEDATLSPQNITAIHQTILPGTYLLLSQDTTGLWGSCTKIEVNGWPGLNNDQDLVCLRDFRGAIVDRVQYQSSWGGGGGKSLEKINPLLLSQAAANWGGCVAPGGSTPGAGNSIYIEKLESLANLSLSPNPFSPDGDGFEDHVLIGFDFAWARAVVNIKIFDRLGRPVKTLAEQQPFGASGTVVWDGRDGGDRACPIGLYIVLLEARDANGSGSVKKKQALALAKKL